MQINKESFKKANMALEVIEVAERRILALKFDLSQDLSKDQWYLSGVIERRKKSLASLIEAKKRLENYFFKQIETVKA